MGSIEHKYFKSMYKVGGGDMKNMEESLGISHEEEGSGTKVITIGGVRSKEGDV